jgi:hypothetical protein
LTFRLGMVSQKATPALSLSVGTVRNLEVRVRTVCVTRQCGSTCNRSTSWIVPDPTGRKWLIATFPARSYPDSAGSRVSLVQ